MECHFLLIFFLAFIPTILARNVTIGRIVVNGTTTIAETDENYICLTMDIWPHNECNSWTKLCAWDGRASMLNVDLYLPILVNAVKAFKSLRIRVGGTLQDRLIYNVGPFKGLCHPFQANKDLLFDFSEGCLYVERWDDLNDFFNKTGAIVTFGLNALLGKYKTKGIQWEGDWNYSNAEALIQYTVEKNYQINSWEFGDDPKLIYRFVDPRYLSQISNVFKQLENTIKRHGPWSAAWVGEAGGAYHGGSPHISDAFINSFWYLDQLGMAALYNTKVYCRQTLMGGIYGVLKASTLVPTPDYYGALLFHRLMGPDVLKVHNNVSSYLRSYAHCSRGRSGVTLLFINLSNETDFEINTKNRIHMSLHKSNPTRNGSHPKNNPSGGLSEDGRKISSHREEYHLTPKDDLLRSSTVLLNGSPLEITKDGELPDLTPIYRESNSSIFITTWSVAFIVIPDFVAPACKL
ncbi:heparanase-like protein 2 [Momordica charantia]|uniref:Heparanase-like protein 2 n=1 Tax=Momordica charantia TaxID=3673 RepID=A0A6J1C8M5_MOMCH|nr:heparanase-like protein 2 [Momordica charantia]